MRRLTSCLIVLGLYVTAALGQNSSNAPKASSSVSGLSDSEVIQRIEDDWLKGERTTDIAVLDRVLADDYINLTPGGLGPGKAEVIKHLQPRAGETPPYALETNDMHVFVLGDTAVAAYVKTYIAKENGNVVREDTTHIFTKDHGAWKLRISRASVRP